MRDSRHRRGACGEAIAALFLESRGYVVLARNLRAGRREIDLVVERGETLVAVEVKWRRAGSLGAGAVEAWRPAQRSRTALAILLSRDAFPGGATRPWRLDLVTLDERPDGFRLVHRPGAAAPGGSWW